MSYPDGEVTHPPGKYVVESPSAGCPLPFSFSSVVKSPGKGEGFYPRAQRTRSFASLHPACFFFHLGVHSPTGSQQCTLLLEEIWNQFLDFAWHF